MKLVRTLGSFLFILLTNISQYFKLTELHHYKHNIVQYSSFQGLLNIFELWQWLVRIGKSTIYQLVFRVIVLLLTLPVCTATTKQAFSTMNIIKIRVRKKIEDKFLTDSLMLYIENEIAATLSTYSIIDGFLGYKDTSDFILIDV
jgi:hypothetical protein